MLAAALAGWSAIVSLFAVDDSWVPKELMFLIFAGVFVPNLLAGIGVLGRRSWARILGLVLSVLVSLVLAYNLVVWLSWGQGVDPNFGILLAGYLFVGFVLATKGAEFA